MSTTTSIPRAGQIECVCEPGALGETSEGRSSVALLAIAFSLSILSQIFSLSILPLAGLALAPSDSLATLPYAAFYAGAALASLPASLLLDAFGRRAAFSLGASLGAAGGMVLVFALTTFRFGALVLGAFWLGIASGFSLFYRHAAVPVGGKGTSAILIVFGAASVAGIVAPTLGATAEAFAAPREFVGLAAAAALAHVGSLIATAALPYRRIREEVNEANNPQGWRAIVLPTAIGAAAWFLMTGLMGATPIAMVGCGLSDAVSGTIAWHVMAMYTPSLVLLAFRNAVKPPVIVSFGALLLVAAAAIFAFSSKVAGFSVSATLLGAGWSLATLGTTLWIHKDGRPSRRLLGAHDAALLSAALLGALAAQTFA
ncbi:hypothetical protein [Microvirga terricola]|uniref:MFS transporter n=1 Tax=Microvirga terricola TaxID=2719797 RepID=A0ABX0VCX3_9HYPH|nr:hypothetical protein [Microvirga terricola]NIX77512.1 hypothetical protein [Microvirga terricola]